MLVAKTKKLFWRFSSKKIIKFPTEENETRKKKTVSHSTKFHINFLRHNFCYNVSSIVVEIIFHRMSEPFD